MSAQHTTNHTAIKQLTERWSAPGGLPFKGKMISNDGCMCAQGQVLHYIGGYTADALRKLDQSKADKETASLLGISTAHAVLLREINDTVDGVPSIVLTHPEKVLGDQAQTILALWWHFDQMTPAAWAAARAAAWAAAGDAAWAAAWDAARDAAGGAARDAAWAAAGAAAWAAAVAAVGAAALATCEIQGAASLRAKGRPFYFLPLFGFADPEAIKQGGAL